MYAEFPTRNLDQWLHRRQEEISSYEYNEADCAAAWTAAMSQVVLTARNIQRRLTDKLDNDPTMEALDRKKAQAQVAILTELVLSMEELR